MGIIHLDGQAHDLPPCFSTLMVGVRTSPKVLRHTRFQDLDSQCKLEILLSQSNDNWKANKSSAGESALLGLKTACTMEKDTNIVQSASIADDEADIDVGEERSTSSLEWSEEEERRLVRK